LVVEGYLNPPLIFILFGNAWLRYQGREPIRATAIFSSCADKMPTAGAYSKAAAVWLKTAGYAVAEACNLKNFRKICILTT